MEVEREQARTSAAELVEPSHSRRRRRVFLNRRGERVKQCNECEDVLVLDRFYIRKDGKVAAKCRVCREKTRDRKKENAQQLKRYHELHEEKLASQREYQRKNRDKYRAASRKWRENNPEKMLDSKKNWYKNNIGRSRAKSMERYARKRNRTPPWLTSEHKKQIEQFYIEARRLSGETGVRYVVDHIHPLHGANLCGLHVPWNLQILTNEENVRKHNKVDHIPGVWRTGRRL